MCTYMYMYIYMSSPLAIDPPSLPTSPPLSHNHCENIVISRILQSHPLPPTLNSTPHKSNRVGVTPVRAWGLYALWAGLFPPPIRFQLPIHHRSHWTPIRIGRMH